jgi:hypothetical protein
LPFFNCGVVIPVYHQPPQLPHQLVPLDEELELELEEELELDELELQLGVSPNPRTPLQCIHSLLDPPQEPFWYTAVL